MHLPCGTKLGPYEIVSFIGAGGMGEVHRARDARLDREVAIKVLSPRISDDPRSLARFHIEAKSIAKLSHPNILAIFDVELEHRPLFLVTELLEGETLRQCTRHSPFPWRRAVEIGIAVAEGLAAAHSEGIIHRDLKPENIFVTNRGSVKILDFGLAQFKPEFRAGDDVATATFSETGLLMGTSGYLAPEQARGERVTTATDIFSFGCVLYEMISGRRAFHGPTPASTLTAILNEDPPSILECITEDVPRELGVWIGRCLEKEQAARPQSAHDLS